MKIVRRVMPAIAAVATTAVTAIAGISTASAFPNNGPVAPFGATLRFHADNGVVIDYTVSDFRASTDDVNYPRFGKLWEANLKVEAVQGSATPVLPFFNARVTTGRQAGRQYRILFQAPTLGALNPATVPEGHKSSGKIYFDCNGSAPSAVVYNDGSQDLLSWQ